MHEESEGNWIYSLKAVSTTAKQIKIIPITVTCIILSSLPFLLSTHRPDHFLGKLSPVIHWSTGDASKKWVGLTKAHQCVNVLLEWGLEVRKENGQNTVRFLVGLLLGIVNSWLCVGPAWVWVTRETRASSSQQSCVVWTLPRKQR